MWAFIKIILILSPIFLLSCTKEPENSNNVVDISEELAQIKKEASKKINQKTLIKLPSKEEIASDISIGNKNPFSSNNSIANLIANRDLKLVGILSTKNNTVALISFKNESGVVKVGDIGGKDTNLLPEGYKTISIDKTKGTITIKFKNDNYVLNILNKSKYL